MYVFCLIVIDYQDTLKYVNLQKYPLKKLAIYNPVIVWLHYRGQELFRKNISLFFDFYIRLG
jgi:hypothetical protein